MIGDHLDQYTSQKLLTQALDQVPDTVDKRQGSIIYDTLSVSVIQLAEAYAELQRYLLNSYVSTAEGDYLDMRAAERGLERRQATAAIKLGTFKTEQRQPATVPTGALFSTAQDSNALIYVVTEPYINPDTGKTVPGQYRLTCNAPGTVGNDYTGSLIAATYVSGVASAELSELLIPGSDTESDDSLRKRYMEDVRQVAFGGNVAQYRQWVHDLDGVGAVQVYPVWNGGGTVKVSILGADLHPANAALIDAVQTALDPVPNQGEGMGIAPIGHLVTVDTPEAYPIQVVADVALRSGWTVEQIQDPIEAVIESYLASLRQEFGQTDSGNYSIHVYRARISAYMMAVEGMENVPTILLNGEDADIALTETPQLQQVPAMGEVTLNAI